MTEKAMRRMPHLRLVHILGVEEYQPLSSSTTPRMPDVSRQVVDLRAMARENPELGDIASDLVDEVATTEEIKEWMGSAENALIHCFNTVQEVRSILNKDLAYLSKESLMDLIHLSLEEIDNYNMNSSSCSFKELIGNKCSPKFSSDFIREYPFLTNEYFSYSALEDGMLMEYNFKYEPNKNLTIIRRGATLSMCICSLTLNLNHDHILNRDGSWRISIDELKNTFDNWLDIDEDGQKMAKVLFPNFNYDIFDALSKEKKYLNSL